MSTEAQKIISSLAVASAALNTKTDALNQHIEHIEAALKALNFGIAVTVESADGSLVLGYGRFTSAWRLYVEIDDPTGKSFSKIRVPLPDAPRLYRLQAIDLIPELLRALISEASDLTDRLTSATAVAQNIVDRLAKVAEEAERGT